MTSKIEYVQGQLLKKGAFGSDFLGISEATGTFMRVREIEERDGVDFAELERTLGALLTKNLSYNNLIAYLGYEHRESSFIILSEYVMSVGNCDGSIASYIREYGMIEERIIRSFTNQIIQGLAYLHAEGMSHNSLSTSNLLLELDGSIKIADFGIPTAAKSFENMPTFQALEPVGEKVDIWSLGAIVIEMFCGRPPWSQNGLNVIDEKPLHNMHISKDAWAKISAQGQSFILDCFTIEPLKRPTASRLLNHPFCIVDQGYIFPETELYKRVRGVYSNETRSSVTIGDNKSTGPVITF